MIREISGWIGAFLGLVLLFLLVCVGIIYPVEAYSCYTYSQATGRPTKMAGISCYVQDGEWYAWEEYKNRFAPKGSTK